MIVTLAGHVDHGKTSLVRALTGVDTDRLEEEKRRGLTIDLGFAYANLGGERIGFVDVPGHHRFIHNMVAGVGRRQHAMLVVAADDGVMPQTREHLQILSLIGLRDGVVAINKIDRVAPQRVLEVREQVGAMAAHSFLAGAPVVEVCCQDGRGIAALKGHLADMAERRAMQREAREFRLAVDRAFSVRGAGAIVTGTVASGLTRPGDPLALATGQPLRLRGLRVQDAPAEQAAEGDRAALNLAGISLDDVSRGDWIVAQSTASLTHGAALALRVLEDFPRPVRHWLPAHAYAATSHAQCRVALLAGAPIAPGAEATVDVAFERALHLKVGDPVILRDQDLGRTLGGGTVIDPHPPNGRRRAPPRLSRLDALRERKPHDALARIARLGVVSTEAFRQDWNLTPAAMAEAIRAAALAQQGDRAMDEALLSQTTHAIQDALASHHRHRGESPGLTLRELANTIGTSADAIEFAAEGLREQGTVRSHAGRLALASHVAEVPAALAALFEQVRPLLDTTQPPSLGDLAKSLPRPLAQLEKEMRALAALGLCERVSPNRFYLPARLKELAGIAKRLQRDGPFTVRRFRDASGVGRNVVIEVLEHFDRQGFTRREGDLRSVAATADGPPE